MLKQFRGIPLADLEIVMPEKKASSFLLGFLLVCRYVVSLPVADLETVMPEKKVCFSVFFLPPRLEKHASPGCWSIRVLLHR